MTIEKNNGNIKIEIAGKIDSSNAHSLEKEIWDSIDFENCTSILLDVENLTMISSVGLRIVLKLKKLCSNLSIIGASPEVYEVFNMTGFTEMMKIEKAYRRLSIEGCEKLGEGSNGIVYRYDPEIVVKVYKNEDALAAIENERKLARKALILGIPTAIPFDVVKVGNSFASVFELLNAKPFSKLISEEPENIDKYIGLFVDLLKKIHSTKVDVEDFSDMKRRALSWANFLKDYLPQEQFEKIASLIDAIPETNILLHGDYHTNNVEMQDGEVLLIDMDTLAYGHPVFELGSMFLGFQGFGELDHSITLNFMKLPYETTTYIWKETLKLYFNTTDEAFLRAVEDKAKLIAYVRLLRIKIKRGGLDNPKEMPVIENCRNKISELLSRVDTLAF